MREWGIMAGILSAVLGLFSGRAHASEYKVAEAYSGLRAMLFSTASEQLGVHLKSPQEVWGVLMETGYPAAVVTLVAVADGTVSIYFSNGGGIIGLGQHHGPHRAAAEFLSVAARFSPMADKVSVYPLPRPKFTRFYMLTVHGVLSVEAFEDDLGNGRHRLSPLFNAGQNLITEIRLVDEKLQAEQAGRGKGK